MVRLLYKNVPSHTSEQFQKQFEAGEDIMGSSVTKEEATKENCRIIHYLQIADNNLDAIKIVLIGPSGAGKSTFINNCLSAIKNTRIVQAPTGKERSVTKMPIPYYLNVNGSQFKVELLDSRGYDLKVETKSMDKIIAGEHQYLKLVPDGDNPGPEDQEPVKLDMLNPKTATVVLFVFSTHWVEKIKPLKEHANDTYEIERFREEIAEKATKEMDKMRTTRNNVKTAGIPCFVLLTCIDEMNPKVKTDILGYSSKRVDIMTAYLKKKFDIENLFPVWNIPDNRPDIDVFQRCHILRILNQITVNAVAFVNNRQHIREEMEKNKKK